MIELARSSVQTWECDQMGHMNVQFYVEKASDALCAFAIGMGLGPRSLAKKGLALEPAEQHMRFLRELRPGMAYYLRGGAVKADVMALTLYTELVLTANDEVCATFVTRAHLRDLHDNVVHGFSDGARAMAMHAKAEIPDYAAPRGIALTPPREPAPKLADAEAMKLLPGLEAVVRPSDCDAHGDMLARFFMARISDAIPNLLLQTSGRNRGDGGVTGGAALEYRFVYRKRPRAGDVLAVRSGLRALGPKTSHWVHWMFDVESGAAVGAAEAVAVALDLETRKAVAISDELRARMEPLLVEGLSV
jgi:acyl-CoA thioester hydrolase